MPISFMATALLAVSLLTNLTIEGVKKLLDRKQADYSSNVLAAIVSVVLAVAISIVYMIMSDVSFSMTVGTEIVVLMYLSFLVSTVGYDKVIQAIGQIQGK